MTESHLVCGRFTKQVSDIAVEYADKLVEELRKEK